MSAELVLVGRIGKPHGIRGEVTIDARTDEPSRRFAPGAVLQVRRPAGSSGASATPPTLLVTAHRFHQERLLVRFDGVEDRNRAEELRGLYLLIELDVDEVPTGDDEYFDHQLIGLPCFQQGMESEFGRIKRVQHSGAQDLLVIETETGAEVLVPFVSALVPLVDVVARRVEIADRPGLLNPDQMA